MLWVHNYFADHRLNHTYIPVECAAEESAGESHPKVGGETDYEKREDCADTTHNQDGLAP